MRPGRRSELLDAARAVRAVDDGDGGWMRLEVAFEDLRHATWALWNLAGDAEVIAPETLRAALRERAATLLARYDAPRG